ncbi:MAG: HAMP domain-containing histidine kinase [Phycisphaerales bacterium]|nr:HAMP domain-containing histidine kinase [Phycisphaerales bacterium]
MHRSLTRRLLAFYLATLMVIVALTCALAWLMMKRALYAAMDDGLQAELLAVASRLEIDEGRLAFEQAPGDAGEALSADAFVLILATHGGVVFSSPALAEDQSLIEAITPDAPAYTATCRTLRLFPDQRECRVASLRRVVRPDEDELDEDSAVRPIGAFVFVARPLAPLQATLRRLTSGLIAVSAAAMLLALAGGAFAVRRGLRPLQLVAADLGRVMPENPHLQVSATSVPIELQPVISTIDRLLGRIREELHRQRCLTADIAHDLRTPVAGMRTLLDVSLQRERSAMEYAAAMEQCRGALRRLSALLDDVMVLSRLDAGVDEVRLQRVPLDAIVEDAVATVQPMAAARGVALRCADCRGVELDSDRAKVTQILANLLSNAIEHGRDGKLVEVGFALTPDRVECAIVDQGPGIAAPLRARIFDRFVRGDATRSGEDGHHGLGLPIALGLARLLGGDIRLDETHFPGACFVVSLPLRSHATACTVGRARGHGAPSETAGARVRP